MSGTATMRTVRPSLMLKGVLASTRGVDHSRGRRYTMEHRFSFPTVKEIVYTRPFPAPPLSQREFVEAWLWRRPEGRTPNAW
jgi:hypothetical protein